MTRRLQGSAKTESMKPRPTTTVVRAGRHYRVTYVTTRRLQVHRWCDCVQGPHWHDLGDVRSMPEAVDLCNRDALAAMASDADGEQ